MIVDINDEVAYDHFVADRDWAMTRGDDCGRMMAIKLAVEGIRGNIRKHGRLYRPDQAFLAEIKLLESGATQRQSSLLGVNRDKIDTTEREIRTILGLWTGGEYLQRGNVTALAQFVGNIVLHENAFRCYLNVESFMLDPRQLDRRVTGHGEDSGETVPHTIIGAAMAFNLNAKYIKNPSYALTCRERAESAGEEMGGESRTLFDAGDDEEPDVSVSPSEEEREAIAWCSNNLWRMRATANPRFLLGMVLLQDDYGARAVGYLSAVQRFLD